MTCSTHFFLSCKRRQYKGMVEITGDPFNRSACKNGDGGPLYFSFVWLEDIIICSIDLFNIARCCQLFSCIDPVYISSCIS